MPARLLAPAIIALSLMAPGAPLAQPLDPFNSQPAEVAAAPGSASTISSYPDQAVAYSLGAGIDDSGPFVGVRLSAGFSPAPSVRLDLVGTLTLGQPSIAGYDAVLARAAAELRVGYRSGRLLPWVGAGMMAASLGGDGPTTANAPYCVYQQICIPTGSTTAQLDGSTHGPVVSAGLLVAMTERLSVGVEVRKAFLPVEGFGGTGILLSMVLGRGAGQ